MPSRAECAMVSPKYAMRRQTTKQPSGAAAIAMPMPATSARAKKSSSIVMAGVVVVTVGMLGLVFVAIGDRAVGVPDPAVGQVGMVVVVRIDGQRTGGARSEQREVLGAATHALRRAA